MKTIQRRRPEYEMKKDQSVEYDGWREEAPRIMNVVYFKISTKRIGYRFAL